MNQVAPIFISAVSGYFLASAASPLEKSAASRIFYLAAGLTGLFSAAVTLGYIK